MQCSSLARVRCLFQKRKIGSCLCCCFAELWLFADQRVMSSFSTLPTETQELIRSRQAEAKRKRLDAKREKQCSSLANSGDSSPRAIHLSSSSSSFADAAHSAQPTLSDQFPDTVSQTQYFAAASGGCFRDPRIPATVSGVDDLLKFLTFPANSLLRTCNYFKFSGSAEQQWDPVLLAKLAYEGFFTITHKTHSSAGAVVEPLPELQPMCANERVLRAPPVTFHAGTAWCSGRTSTNPTTTKRSCAC